MNKISYIFGAGASRNALPMVKDIPDRLKSLINLLKSEKLQLSKEEKFKETGLKNLKSKKDYQEELIIDLQWLLDNSSKHASVDTFARKLSIIGDHQNLKKLKVVLSVFFTFEQIIKQPDERYDSFFASLYNEDNELPKNIRILSWNYDSQFELSYRQYSREMNTSNIQAALNISYKYGNNHERNRFGIYKLNGTTGLRRHNGNEFVHYGYTNNLNVEFDINIVDEIIRSYTVGIFSRKNIPVFSFAWETENKPDNIIEIATKATEDSIALVVIGYSFPFFNRNTDRKIIGAMKDLKRVYFQSPDAEILIEKFKAIKNDIKEKDIELIPRYDLEQFVIPYEL
jgi:hypothetical protein